MRIPIKLVLPTTLVLAGIGALAVAEGCGSSSTDPQPITYVSTMTGANERPNPVNTAATGTATYVLRGNIITYTVTVANMSSNVNNSHIHEGTQATPSGHVVVPFTINPLQNGVIAQGTIDLSTLPNATITITSDSLLKLLNNGTGYTNVHTVNFGAGEIRGQLVRQ